ncbi:MAG: hypothetical protein KAS23_02735, partial [Anaerohalosphaera sp.]|nr:hypothetical protein [Anaerohalosphaera sp.]
MRNRIRKLLIVVFLTLFIWVWAYNTLEESTQHLVALTTARSANPEKLVSFEGADLSVNIEINITGPASKVTELRKDIDNNAKQLQYTFNVVDDKKYLSSDNMLDITEFIKDRAKADLPGFTIESASPSTIKVLIEELVPRTVDVIVVDENDFPIEADSITPRSVQIYVPKDTADTLKARVRLTKEQIAKARTAPITETHVY